MSFSNKIICSLLAAVCVTAHAQFVPPNVAPANIDDLIQSSNRAYQEYLKQQQSESNQGKQVDGAASKDKTAKQKLVPPSPGDAIDRVFNPSLPVTQQQQQPRQEQKDPVGTVYYLVSYSMPRELLRDTLMSLGKNEVVVFRGPVKGEDMKDFAKRMHDLVGPISKNESERPNLAVQVDPIRFKSCGVTLVPATCISTSGAPLVATGVLSGEYLQKRGQSDNRILGEVWQIAEIDLAEELRKRIMSIKREDLIKDTVRSVFMERNYVKLPRTTRNEAFVFDPSVQRTEDMIAGGRVIVKAGQKYNPLGNIPLRHTYVVLDASDKKQVDTSLKIVQQLRGQKRDVKVIISDLSNRENGFEVIPELSRRFGVNVTMLDKELAKVFRLRSVPAVVDGTPDLKIRVNEVVPL